MLMIGYYILIAGLFALSVVFGLRRSLNKTIVRVIFMVLTVALSVLVTRLLAPVLAKSCASLVLSLAGPDLGALSTYIGSGAAGATALLQLIGAMLAPLLFLGVFLLLDLLIWIVFIFVHKKITFIKEENHVGFKIGSVAANIALCFIVVSILTTPLAFVGSTLDALGVSAALPEEITQAVGNTNSAGVKVFAALPRATVLSPLTSIKSPQGTRTNVMKALPEMIGAVEGLSAVTDSLSSGNATGLFVFASSLQKSLYVDELFGAVISDMAKEPSLLTSLLGSGESDSASLASQMLSSLSSENMALSTYVKLGASALSMQQVLSPSSSSPSSSSSSSKETMETMFLHMDTSSAKAVSKLLQGEVVTDLLGEQTASESAAVASMFADVTMGIAQINEDPSLTEEERVATVKKESAAVHSLIQVTQGEANADPIQIISTIASSSVLRETVQNLTENGTKKNPLGIDDLPIATALSTALKESNVAETDPLHQALTALLSE